MQAADKKRPREEKDVVVRLRPFAKLQTGGDFEHFVADILCVYFCSFVTGLPEIECPQMSKYFANEYKNFNTIVGWVLPLQLISTSMRLMC